MINFDEELRKFTESMEIDQVEEAVNRHDLTDVTELLQQVVMQNKQLSNQVQMVQPVISPVPVSPIQ